MPNARGLRIALLALMMFCVSWVAMAGSAWAAVRLQQAPSGWSTATEDEEARAETWAEAVGGELIEAYGPEGDSDTDLIALVQTPGQLTSGDFEDPTSLANLYAPVFGADEASSVVTVELGEGLPPGVRARFESDDAVVDLLVVSAGDNRGLLVFATTADGEKLYGPLFDAAIGDLTGVEGPSQRFEHEPWWMGFAGGWVLMTLALVVILRIVSSGDTATQIGRRAAAILVGLSLLVMAGSYVVLADSQTSIAASGFTRFWLAAEAGLMGLAAAGVLMVVASLISAASRPIQSAPTGGGTWAAATPATPPIPVVPQAPVAGGHPDGTGQLTDAHDPIPAGPPSAPLVPPPMPSGAGAPPPPPASALANGALVTPSPVSSSPRSGVAPARTAPIVLRGSDKLSGPAAPTTGGSPSLGAPEQPLKIDRTLVGQGPKGKPFAFPAPMSSPPPPPEDEDDG